MCECVKERENSLLAQPLRSPVWTGVAVVSGQRAGLRRCTPSREAARCALTAPVSSVLSSSASLSSAHSTCDTRAVLSIKVNIIITVK